MMEAPNCLDRDLANATAGLINCRKREGWMRLQIRTAWMMSGAVILALVVSIASLMGWMRRAGVEPGDMAPEGRVFLLFFFGAPLALGIAFGWWRMFDDRRQSRNRAAPLDMDPPQHEAQPD